METSKITRLMSMMNVQEAMDQVAIFLSAHKNDGSISDGDFDLTELRNAHRGLYAGKILNTSHAMKVWRALAKICDLMIEEKAQANPNYWLVKSMYDAKKSGELEGVFPCVTCGGTVRYVVLGHSWNPDAKPIRAQCDGCGLKINA